MTLFVPIVHERAPSHGPPEKASSRFCIQHQACSVRPTESRLRADCSILLLLVLPSSHQPPPTQLGHPVAHLTMLVLKEKEILMPWELKVESEHIPTVECFTITSLQFHYIQRSCLPFRFAGFTALLFRSAPRPLFHSIAMYPYLCLFYIHFPQFSVGSYRVRSSEVSMLSSLFCCRPPISYYIYIFLCVSMCGSVSVWV